MIELLMRGQLSLTGDAWSIVVQDADGLNKQSEMYSRFATLAVADILLWLEKLCQLSNLPFSNPAIDMTRPTTEMKRRAGAVHVNFSVLQRYTDENEQHPETIYVRTDYFSANLDTDGKNYFQVETAPIIDYKLQNTPATEEILEFFLKNIFQKNNFREGQLPIILNVLNGRDTIGLLPTGGGKSLCYQLPCLLQPAISFVVCPIKSLMYDQKDNLDKAYITRTNYITGELTPEEKAAIQQEFADRRYFFIWISPERFQIKSFRKELQALNATTPIAYAVIDEVHCMSEWGHDFRTSYLNLTKTIHEYCPRAKLIGLTATASLNVLRNIRIEFARQDSDGSRTKEFSDEDVKTKLDFSRPELRFEIIRDKGDKAAVLEKHLKALEKADLFLTPNTKNVAGLLFTPHANGPMGCYDNANVLNNFFPKQVNWFSGTCPERKEYIHILETSLTDAVVLRNEIKKNVGDRISNAQINAICRDPGRYFAKFDNFPKRDYKRLDLGKVAVMTEKEFEEHKIKAQKEFKDNKFPLMIATKAFGMGVDKQNIEYTFHYGIPGSTESLYQEAGRAGRWDKRQPENKGKEAVCTILFSPETIAKDQLDTLFKAETTLTEIREIIDSTGDEKAQAGDALRQFFLFQNGYDAIDVELDTMQKLLSHVLTLPKAPVVNVLYKWPTRDFEETGEKGEAFFRMLSGISTDRAKMRIEKALYRLSLLGFVKNWTTDFVCHFAVEFTVPTEEQVIANLMQHLIKYRRDYADKPAEFRAEILRTPGINPLEQCMRYLLDWTWNEIAYGRRISLKTLYDLCVDFGNYAENASERFKRSLDNYFRVDNTTIVFQYIADEPRQFGVWPQAFQTKDGAYTQDFNEWKDRSENLARFIETGQYNLGRDAISGIFKLALGDYEHADGQARLERTLSRIDQYFSPDETRQVLQTIVTIVLGLNLPNAARYQLADSIERFFPNSYNWTSDTLKIIHIPQLENVNQRLNTLNQKLYDKLSKI